VLRLIVLLLSAGVAACVPPSRPVAPDGPPPLRLAPADLPGGMAAQQRLDFEHGGERRTVDALVEVDAQAVRVVIHAQGQVALRLEWDGRRLTQTRADWLPPQLSAERVLTDLQLVYWPVDAVAAALPAPWTFSRDRELARGGEVVARVERVSGTRSILHQQAYRLRIHSVPVTP
jgi:hypothetical protein